jgi:methionine-R-sulfoxide reductase
MYSKLTKEEERVIIHKGTEAPFSGEYVNTFDKGTYFCRQCDAPLYHSKDKFHSDCGWPSFDQEIEGAVKQTTDADGRRTEITCAKCGAHLGHVFDDGPKDKGGLRYCINSASLKFIPKNEMKAKGYGEYLKLFDK